MSNSNSRFEKGNRVRVIPFKEASKRQAELGSDSRFDVFGISESTWKDLERTSGIIEKVDTWSDGLVTMKVVFVCEVGDECTTPIETWDIPDYALEKVN